MSVVAIYNMKGGVGKTTTAVNLSYLAATAGQRTLLWDLDPQAASSFAFRVQPRVPGFGRKSLRSGEALAAAIKATDYDNLDLLPADFAYRKLDRLLGHYGNPARVITTLLDTLGRDYDAVFLDCPAGFPLVIEGVFAAADAVIVPTIPTVLSLRMVARVLKWANRSNSPAEVAAFFSMVDRRKALHRRACDWARQPEIFLKQQVPYASVVEQMTVRRMPLPVFAARDAAATAFAGISAELQTRLQQRAVRSAPPRDRWALPLHAIESLVTALEAGDGPESPGSSQTPAITSVGKGDSSAQGDVQFVHNFDTDDRNLQRLGYVLELRERLGSLRIVVARSDGEDRGETAAWAQARIDRCWAIDILAGAMSPLAALERRLETPRPELVEKVMAIVGGQKLRRMSSRAAGINEGTEGHHRPNTNRATGLALAADRVAAPRDFPLHMPMSQHG